MEPIRILPHHAQGVFDVFYLGKEPEKTFRWHSDAQKCHAAEKFKEIVSNPDQLVQIVDSYDAICKVCPKNKNSSIFHKKSIPCNDYDIPNAARDWKYTKVLGLQKSIRSIMTSAQLKELMQPTYEKFLLAVLKEPAISTKYSRLNLFVMCDIIYDMCRQQE